MKFRKLKLFFANNSMSEPIEAKARQQNQSNDVPNTNAGTTAQHSEGLFAMPEIPSTNEVTQKKARRG